MNTALEVWPIKERIRSKIRQAENGCHEWTGCNRRGYGTLCWREDGKPKMAYAHRLVWQMHYGPIPDGMFVMHSCDNKLCCNIAHLSLGTAKDNISDCIRKGRQWWQVRHA